MRPYVLFPSFILLILGTGSLAQDGACPSSGMGPYDYMQALCMSFLFYEAQRSGYLPADQRVTWRKDSALTDGQDVGYDLTGGYYDAGDYVKFGLPLGFATATLSWGLIEYPEGYSRSGQTEYARAAIKVATDWLLKAHNNPYEIYGQVGDGYLDHEYWGRPEDMTMERPSFKINSENPGSELAGENAAALAAAYLVFRDVDSDYANSLLEVAREMLDFADSFRAVYTDSIPAEGFYTSFTGYGDELAWGAIWLYKATGEQQYMDKALSLIDEFGLLYYAENFFWDDVTPGVYALMAELNSDPYWTTKLDETMNHFMYEKQYTPNGLVFANSWGSLRYASGLAFIGMRAASLGINSDTIRAWSQTQLDYILGSQGHSFMVGFGVDPPKQCHHRAASCNDAPEPCDYSDMYKAEDNPHVLYGAMVGGPDQYDNWVDNRTNWEQAEVGLDYNSCLTSLLAATVELH